jgi:predicted RNA-binding protein with EMAP domain
MPSFKPKTTKKFKVSKKYTTTLDGKHKEFINEFSKNETEIIPTLKLEKKQLKIQLLENPDLQIEQVMDIKDRIKEITETIKDLQNQKKKYLLDNSKYVFEYFENKKKYH